MLFKKPFVSPAVMIITMFFLSVCSVSATAQNSTEDPVVTVQKELINIVENEKKQHDINCRKVFQRSFFTDSNISSKISGYLQCSLKKLDFMTTRWRHHLEELFTIAALQLKLTPEVEKDFLTDFAQRKLYASRLAKQHRGLVNWYRSAASLVRLLHTSQFIDQEDAEEFMKMLQSGLNRTSGEAKVLSTELLAEKVDQATLIVRIERISTHFFSQPKSFIENMKKKIRVAGRRHSNQLIQLFGKFDHPNDMERIYKGYDVMIAAVFEAFINNSRIAWTDLRAME